MGSRIKGWTVAGALTAAGLAAATPAQAQLEIFEDYELSDEVWVITTVKVEPTQIDYYLAGIKETWVQSNEIAKELGQIQDYAIYASDHSASGDFNLLLAVQFENDEYLTPNKERYEAFMAQWGEQREEETRETAESYPAMRELTGEYRMRRLTIN
ncbi:MAG: hypothetical protein MI723_18095 [Caulobacterales bacterium]|nr:hypothetical protein [Caulobacterales bacterium]